MLLTSKFSSMASVVPVFFSLLCWRRGCYLRPPRFFAKVVPLVLPSGHKPPRSLESPVTKTSEIPWVFGCCSQDVLRLDFTPSHFCPGRTIFFPPFQISLLVAGKKSTFSPPPFRIVRRFAHAPVCKSSPELFLNLWPYPFFFKRKLQSEGLVGDSSVPQSSP